MEKRIIEAFLILIIILFGVSLVSEANEKVNAQNEVQQFEESVNDSEEITNGVMEDVHLVEEDSSNVISDVNARVATLIVGCLNKIFKLCIKLVEGMAS